MILSFNYQASVFITAAVTGMMMGLCYDLIRIFRLVIKHKNVFVHIEDCIFWMAAAFGAFVIMLAKNNGGIRPFVIAGVGLGMLFYFSLPSVIVMGASKRIVNKVRTIFAAILRPVFRGMRIILYPVKKLKKKLDKRTKKHLQLCRICAKLKLHKLVRQSKTLTKK